MHSSFRFQISNFRVIAASLIFIFVIFISLFAKENEYYWPAKNNIGVVSSSFGEFRRTHFHAGVDISTQGVKNVPALAIADGILWEIRVTPHGYGRALTLKLDDGNFAMYAHLKSYCKKVDELVREGQEEMGAFSINFCPRGEPVRFKKGEQIGVIGGAGGFKPHVHLELTDSKGNYINPLTHGIGFDTVYYPKIKELAFVPLEDGASINGKQRKVILQSWLDKNTGKYRIQDPVRIYGHAGIEVETEFLSEVGNKLAPYKISLFVDDELYYELINDRFTENDFKRNYHIFDRELYLNGKGFFFRLFKAPEADYDSHYLQAKQGKRLYFSEGQHNITIRIENYDGLQRELTFEIQVQSLPPESKKHPDDGETCRVAVTGKECSFDNGKFLVEFPQESFTREQKIGFDKVKFQGSSGMLKVVTSIYSVTPEDLVPNKSFKVYLKIPSGYRERKKYLGIFQVEPQRIRFLEADRDSKPGYIGASILYPSRVLIMEDASAPSISHIKPANGASLTAKKPTLRATIVDKTSRLNYKSLKMYLNGKEIPAEFNVVSGELLYRPRRQFDKGSYSLKIIAEDNVGNKRTKTSEFRIR